MRPREETVNKNTSPVSEARCSALRNTKSDLLGLKNLRTLLVDITRNQVWKLRDPGSGCLFSVLIVMAFLHATHLIVPRWLPQHRLVLLWPEEGQWAMPAMAMPFVRRARSLKIYLRLVCRGPLGFKRS